MLSMFRRKPAVLEPEPELVAPSRVKFEPALVGEVELSEYVKLAEEIGFAPGALLRHRLVNFLRESNIDVYPTDKVTEYLDKLFGNGSRERVWGWRPLRSEDVEKVSRGLNYWQNGEILQVRYHQIVPAPVLQTVKLIADNFKSSDPEVHFYVSDSLKPWDGDPFLAAIADGMEPLVIERWDEPSFRQ